MARALATRRIIIYVKRLCTAAVAQLQFNAYELLLWVLHWAHCYHQQRVHTAFDQLPLVCNLLAQHK
jgi:hypothetical protein